MDSRAIYVMRKSLTEFFSPVLVSDARRRAVLDELLVGVQPTITYYVLLGLATMIAGIGLLSDSTAVVIGAMLVSPLMTPMFGVAVGLTRGDLRLVGRSLLTVLSGTVLCVALAALLGLLPFALEVTPQMAQRTHPTLLDLLVAMFAGLAACLTWIDERVSPVLPGVAIATSLVPPLATCGLVLAFGEYGRAWGAFLLFFANFVAIAAVSAAVFIMFGFVRAEEVGSERARRGAAWGTIGALAAVGALLTYSLVVGVREWTLQRQIETVIDRHFVDDPNTVLEKVAYRRSQRESTIFVLSTIRTPRVISPTRVRTMEDALEETLGSEVTLDVRCVITRDVSPLRSDPTLVMENFDGTIGQRNASGDAVLVTKAERLIREFLATSARTTLDDIYMLHLDTGPVVVAEVTSTSSITPNAVATVETRLRRFTGHSSVRLLVRSVTAVDITAKGKVLFGNAHFGPPGLDYAAMGNIEAETRKALEARGDIFVNDIDVVESADAWLVRGEVVGARVLGPQDLSAVEKKLSAQAGKPVKLTLLSRAEVLSTSEHLGSLREATDKEMAAAAKRRDTEVEQLEEF